MNAVRPKIRWLTDDAVEQIILEARRVLRKIGVFVETRAAITLLLDAGCRMSPDRKRVLFDDGVIDRALSTAPSAVRLFDRDGNESMVLAGDKIHFNPGSAALHVYDGEKNVIRDGVVDGFAVGGGLFGTGIHHRAVRFRNRELGERVRQATLEGFKDHHVRRQYETVAKA